MSSCLPSPREKCYILTLPSEHKQTEEFVWLTGAQMMPRMCDGVNRRGAPLGLGNHMPIAHRTGKPKQKEGRRVQEN